MISAGNTYTKTGLNPENKNKGQALLFVVVAVAMAMAIGVSVSTRTISSLKRASRTDTSARVIAAAEGGIENLLGRNYSELNAAVDDGSVDCEAIGAVSGPESGTCTYVFSSSNSSSQQCAEYECKCTYCAPESEGCKAVLGSSTDTDKNSSLEDSKDQIAAFTPEPDVPISIPAKCGTGKIKCTTNVSCSDGASWCSGKGGSFEKTCKTWSSVESSGDKISSRAVVKVETFNTNEENGYAFDLKPGMVKEVYLPSGSYGSNSIEICFKSNNSALYYYSYKSDGTILKGGLKPSSGGTPSNMLSTRFEVASTTNKGGSIGNAFCKTVNNLVSNHYGLRIKTLFNPTKAAVYPVSGYSLPTQGYKLTSRGEVSEGATEERATVIVHKSFPYAADIFDYGIYTPGELKGGN